MDPIEVIKAYILKEQKNPSQWDKEAEASVLSAYRALSPEQGHELALSILNLCDVSSSERGSLARYKLRDLAILAPGSLNHVYSQLIEREIFWPGELYVGADSQTRDQLIALIEGSAAYVPALDWIFQCLAWIGDATVQAKFSRWRYGLPPRWRGVPLMYPAVEDFTKEAGWEVTREGQRRDLFTANWFKLLPVEASSAPGKSAPVVAGTYHEEQCPWCGRQLVHLLDVDLRDPQMALLGVTGERLRIPCCEWCFMYGTFYIDVDFNGAAHWSEVNSPRPTYAAANRKVDSRVKERRYIPGPLQTNPYEPLLSYVEYYASRLGGAPDWVQCPEYPLCPGCGEVMRCIAQMEPAEFISWGPEGSSYIFLCVGCGKAATGYQQT